MADQPRKRVHTAEFRLQIVERMLAGENVTALSKQHRLPRSMMYRWRDAYRGEGTAGLARANGQQAKAGARKVKPATTTPEDKLRAQVAELERKVGQQAIAIDFFKEVFKRLDELPKAPRPGGNASTQRS